MASIRQGGGSPSSCPRPLAGLLVVLWAVCCLGCSKKLEPDTFYRLSPDGPSPEGLVKNPEIGVGPIDMPDYVDRSELVFQSSPARFEIPANHRWAGSLQSNISTVLTTNLARRLHPRGVVEYPFANAIDPDIRVAVRIHQFHALSGGDALLEASWFISSAGVESTRSGTFDAPLETDGYDGVVAAQSLLIGDLADAIQKDIRLLDKAKVPQEEPTPENDPGEEQDEPGEEDRERRENDPADLTESP